MYYILCGACGCVGLGCGRMRGRHGDIEGTREHNVGGDCSLCPGTGAPLLVHNYCTPAYPYPTQIAGHGNFGSLDDDPAAAMRLVRQAAVVWEPSILSKTRAVAAMRSKWQAAIVWTTFTLHKTHAEAGSSNGVGSQLAPASKLWQTHCSLLCVPPENRNLTRHGQHAG